MASRKQQVKLPPPKPMPRKPVLADDHPHRCMRCHRRVNFTPVDPFCSHCGSKMKPWLRKKT